ncbi:MAG: hypothetical protein M3Y55_01690, partial [Pseudomonadota bacterium]|nr:hypothetical protein [Pseudomonadota bacterium]
LGVSLDHTVLHAVVVGLLVVVAAVHLWRRAAPRVRAPAGQAALALWSFMMSTAHGAGLMLVPALIPFCIGHASVRSITASGSLALALAAVGVHSAAMLLVTGVIAVGICCGPQYLPRTRFNASDWRRWTDSTVRRVAPRTLTHPRLTGKVTGHLTPPPS